MMEYKDLFYSIEDELVDGIQWYRDSNDIANMNFRCEMNGEFYFIKRNDEMWELIVNDSVIDRDQYRIDLKRRITKYKKQSIEKF